MDDTAAADNPCLDTVVTFQVKGLDIGSLLVLLAEAPDHAAIKMFLIVVDEKQAGCGKTELLFRTDQDGSQDLIQTDLLRQEARYPEDGRNGPVLRFQLFSLRTHCPSPAFPVLDPAQANPSGSGAGLNRLPAPQGCFSL
jgi:hypothetical protein